MNERIKELAKEHGFVRWDYDSLSYELKGDIEDLYAFADLIVRECLDIAYEHDEPKMSGPGMIIAGRIEKHFGVEE